MGGAAFPIYVGNGTGGHTLGHQRAAAFLIYSGANGEHSGIIVKGVPMPCIQFQELMGADASGKDTNKNNFICLDILRNMYRELVCNSVKKPYVVNLVVINRPDNYSQIDSFLIA